MQSPRKPKYRKQMKRLRHLRGTETRGCELNEGDYGLMVLESCLIDARHIEAGRVAISRNAKRSGRLWIRMFPRYPITSKPAEVRQGKGKGATDKWVEKVRPGRIIYEVTGLEEEIAIKALSMAARKMPCKCRVVKRSAFLI